MERADDGHNMVWLAAAPGAEQVNALDVDLESAWASVVVWWGGRKCRCEPEEI